MHAQISLNNINVAPSPENYETLNQLVQIIDFAEELTILFARCNVPILRQTLATEAIRQLAVRDITVVVIEWAENKGAFLDYVGQTLSPAITTEERLVVFVYGLEQSMPSSAPYPPILAELNSARELFHRDAPYPIVFWLPDYALTTLARGALDFWAWRSGVFEFETEPIYRTQALHLYARQDADWLAINNMTPKQKHRRRHVLQNLLADYEALPQDKQTLAERAEILFTLGQLNQAMGNYEDAHCCYQQSLIISERLDNRSQAANTLHRIGTLYLLEGKHEQARVRYEQSLAVSEQIGIENLQASALHELGNVHYVQKEYQKAQRYYEQSQTIAEQIGDHSIEASSLHQLGMVQLALRKYTLASLYYQQALMLKQKMGDQAGIGQSFHQLGALCQVQGYNDEAQTYYERALKVFQELGAQHGIARSLALIGLLSQEQGDVRLAVAMLAQALAQFEKLGTPEQETIQTILTDLQM